LPRAALDYSAVSETPGDQVLPSALAMAKSRYLFAAQHAVGTVTLEVACGSGHGLGVLANVGRRVIGMDITHALLEQARHQYGGRVTMLRADALAVPLQPNSVDTVVIFEAIYYLPDIASFLGECARIVRPEGRLLVCWANPEHYEFGRGSHTFHYPTADEMKALLLRHGFLPTLYGGFATQRKKAGQRFVSTLKRAAGRLGVIPGTMRGKSLLKRLFYGKLVPFPVEITADATAPQPVPLTEVASPRAFQVIYAMAVRQTNEQS
jgi:ubiquinone/menaquinone biosynthesis C-methylase UbiE